MRTIRAATALLFLFIGFVPADPVRVAAAADPGGLAGSGIADFTLLSLDGNPVTLSDYTGKKPVLLVFWATWCPECKAAIPGLNALNGGPLSGSLQVLALDFRESGEKVAAAVKSRGIRYPVLLDEHGSVARAYGVVGIPTYVLIGRDGKIVFRQHTLPANLSTLLRRTAS